MQPAEPVAPPQAPGPTSAPELPDETPDRRRFLSKPDRWAPVAALVTTGIVALSVLTGPSGLAPEYEALPAPSVTAQTTTNVPEPGSRSDQWRPAAGTWVGGFAFTSQRPDTLYGPSMAAGLLHISPATVIVDSLPDGRLVGVDGDNQLVVLIGAGESGPSSEVTPLPWPGPGTTPPLVSPDGTRLAMIDAAGVPHTWVIGSESMTSPGDSALTAMGPIASLLWSPDSTILALNVRQGGYYLWSPTAGDLSAQVMPGRAIAVSDTQVAAWSGNGLELRHRTGRVLRRWNDLVGHSSTDSTSLPTLIEGAFDPQLRYLAVKGHAGRDDDEQAGLTVLSMVGTARVLLTTDPAQGFAWSGDGSGLYWINTNGLQAWSADPERAPATLVGRGSNDVFLRLRVYDPAISPVSHPALTTSHLLERREEGIYVRTGEGLGLLDGFEDGVGTITTAGIPAHFLSVTTAETERPVLLATAGPGAPLIVGSLDSSQLPEGTDLAGAVAVSPGSAGIATPLRPESTRWYLETQDGSILHGPDAGVFTAAAEGSSLESLAETTFHITPDGSKIQTIPNDAGIRTLLGAADLEAERILALGVIHRTLFVLVSTADGTAQIWQVPADSPLLATPLFPPAPSITSWAWIVHSYPGRATGGAILTEPDARPEVFATRIDGPAGPITVVVAAPMALQSVCSVEPGGACVLTTRPGRPLGFSPDGHWLLLDDDGRYSALSTVGRGNVLLPDPAPDQVAWVEATR